MRQNFLYKLRQSVELADDPVRASKMLDAMEDCMPRGALFERRDEQDCGRHCGYSKLCPWCHARSVQRLYRRLIEGPCSASNLEGKTLVLVRMRSQIGDCSKTDCDYARWAAKDLGMTGGIVFYQYGPSRVYGPRSKVVANIFSQDITMIGESADITAAKMMSVHEETGYDLMLLPADTPHALRYLLFGTPYNYPADRIKGLVATECRFPKHGMQPFTFLGIPGAASLQPWVMFDETQAWSYLAAMASKHLCDRFGTWRKNGQPAVNRISTNRSDEIITREQALRNENNERQYEAANRRAVLMRKAEMVFRKLKADMGRNPGSTALRKALTAAGFVVTDRDGRWLAKQMPLYYQGEPDPYGHNFWRRALAISQK